MEAWNENNRTEFKISDVSSDKIDTYHEDRVKAALTQKIRESTHVLVIIGKDANKEHPNSERIGDRNWVNWEINKAKQLNKQLVAIKLDKTNESPYAIMDSNACWAWPFKKDKINRALDGY